jgi:hypothetical protein
MFRRKTLLVVGAGASCEANLPSGHDLKRVIANMLDMELSPRPARGDPDIYAALVRHAAGDRDALVRLLIGAQAIREGMPLAISIDNFLDAHQGNDAIETCGKLAIVKAVLDAEAGSLLYHPDPTAPFKMSGLADTWYVRLAQLITEDVQRSAIGESLENLSILTFNYDRCIEHFLRQAFISYYQLPPDEAEALVGRITISHPYGQVGRLDWQDPEKGVPFGTAASADLLAISRQIRTFTERIDDEDELASFRDLVADAQTIVFLGFAYHRQNLRLLNPDSVRSDDRKTLLGTALGLSASDIQVISGEVAEMLPVKSPVGYQYGNNRLETEPMKCHVFLSAFARTLTAGR